MSKEVNKKIVNMLKYTTYFACNSYVCLKLMQGTQKRHAKAFKRKKKTT